MSKEAKRSDFDNAARIIRDSGGKVVGRTKLQKMTYLLELAGLGDGFLFQYRHYGPYSEQLSQAIELSDLFGLVKEEEYIASWGGRYSIYSFVGTDSSETSEIRKKLLAYAVDADPVELELAATAAFLCDEGAKNVWQETSRRKPEKSTSGRIEKAQRLYSKLMEISGGRLPELH